MQYAIVLSLCVVAASPVSPSRETDVEAAAQAFRIESYNRCREDRERYQQLRDADDELRVGLAATKEAALAGRQEEALRWYQEATAAVHAGEEVPASPVWLPEALADAAAGKLRVKPSAPVFARNGSTKRSLSTDAIPPQLAPAKSGEQAIGSKEEKSETPFFFVNAALKAIGGSGAGGAKVDDVKEPVIHPAGPIVDGRVEEPETTPAKGSRTEDAPSHVEPQPTPRAAPIEPTLELPTLGSDEEEKAPVEAPAIELPELSSE